MGEALPGLLATRQVADAVRMLRARRRWSANKLAAECARFGTPLSRSTIAKIESGLRKSITADEVSALAAALGVPAADLMDPPSSVGTPWAVEPESFALDDRTLPTVPAVKCNAGHDNPPDLLTCRRCGAATRPDRVSIPQPTLGTLQFETGKIALVDRSLLLGRRPTLPPDHHGPDPALIALPDSSRQVSRTHLAVRVDEWRVAVEDLDSVNGTTVDGPGQEAQRLNPGEPVPIEDGMCVLLAGTLRIWFKATS